MGVRNKARSRLTALAEGYPLKGGKGWKEKPSANVSTDTNLTNMSFARAMAGKPGAPGGGASAVRKRGESMTLPQKQSTADVRREAEQSQGVMRNPGRMTAPDYKDKGYRESLSKRKSKR